MEKPRVFSERPVTAANLQCGKQDSSSPSGRGWRDLSAAIRLRKSCQNIWRDPRFDYVGVTSANKPASSLIA